MMLSRRRMVAEGRLDTVYQAIDHARPPRAPEAAPPVAAAVAAAEPEPTAPPREWMPRVQRVLRGEAPTDSTPHRRY